MVFQIWKLHSLFRIHNKYLFEKIFHLHIDVFELLFFCNSRLETEIRMITPPIDLSFHIMTFKGVLGKKHEVKEYSESPYIDGDSIIWIANNLRCHIFLCPTMSLCPWAPNRSCKAKISNFISNIVRILVFEYSFE